MGRKGDGDADKTAANYKGRENVLEKHSCLGENLEHEDDKNLVISKAGGSPWRHIPWQREKKRTWFPFSRRKRESVCGLERKAERKNKGVQPGNGNLTHFSKRAGIKGRGRKKGGSVAPRNSNISKSVVGSGGEFMGNEPSRMKGWDNPWS